MRSEKLITVIGCHVGGEQNDVITGGVLPPPGATMFEKKLYLEREADWLRRMLLFEPRGKVTACVNLVVPPTDPRADAGFIIMESVDYPPMSGSNTICTTTVLLETGMLAMREPETRLLLETPAGLIPVVARCRGGRVEQVRFSNVPAFAVHLDATVEVPELGSVRVDVAYGGAFFAIVDAASLGFAISRDEARDLVRIGNAIRDAAAEQLPAVHPENDAIRRITFTEFAGPWEGPGCVSRNAVIVAPGRIDRSPCGTGSSARLAVLHAKGRIRAGESFTHESIIGARFEVGVESVGELAGRPAVITSIAGRAFVTGVFQHALDPEDPWREGYTLPDTWFV
ncbi:MAG: proline racemase family protein [Acidisphaera sp.]|nr:proline racemase family protein [Acidisphaera sp.]